MESVALVTCGSAGRVEVGSVVRAGSGRRRVAPDGVSVKGGGGLVGDPFVAFVLRFLGKGVVGGSGIVDVLLGRVSFNGSLV